MIINGLLIIYFIGFLIALFQGIKAYFALWSASERMRDLVTGGTAPGCFLILRIVLWPYYVLRYHSPASYFSELFFKHYGDLGKTYSGTQGPLNFYHDIFHRRYFENLSAKRKLVELNPEAVMYRKAVEMDLFPQGDTAYASVIFAKDVKNNFFLSINFCREYRDFKGDAVSRYELYDCQKFSEKAFISAVDAAIYQGCGEQLVDQLNQ